MQILIQTDREEDTCYLGFSEGSTTQGGVARSVRVNDDVALEFDGEGRLVGLDILNATKVLGESFEDLRLDALVGVKEAAEIAGVQRSNFVRDLANSADFPKPVAELATGRIWLRSQVQSHLAAKQARTRKPRSA